MKFYKINGAGNDFIFPIDKENLTENEIKNYCRRGVSIGGDGIIFVKKHAHYDFEMIYYNSDGSLAQFCGNGARSAVLFAKERNLISKDSTNFLAGDGEHKAFFIDRENIKLQMNYSKKSQKISINNFEDITFLNTGVEHIVVYINSLKDFNVNKYGRELRYNPMFPKGTNVNFVEKNGNKLSIRTYERGVESETYACGTGITAAGIVEMERLGSNEIDLKTVLGYSMKVSNENGKFFLTGPANIVYKGETY